MKPIKLMLALATLTAICLLTQTVSAQKHPDSLAALGPSASATGGATNSAAWETDFTTAQQQARAGRKYVLLDFTGSDWCPWCMRLDSEILATPEFRAFANKHLVLVKVDFPRHHIQSVAEQAQNNHLAAQFQVQGFPTAVLLNSDGQEIGSLGYMYGGPKPFIDKLAGMITD